MFGGCFAGHGVSLDSESPATLVGSTIVDALARGEFGFLWIRRDVSADSVELLRMPDQMIEDFLLPEGSGATKQSIDGCGCVLHPGRALCLHRRCVGKSGQQMDMIGHDNKVSQFVADTIKVLEG